MGKADMSNSESEGGSREDRGSSTAHDRHHAEKRRARRDATRRKKGLPPAQPPRQGGGRQTGPEDPSRHLLYGLHTVRHALANPKRRKRALHVTANGLRRLDVPQDVLEGIEIIESLPRELDRMTGDGAVHQGCVLDCEPLASESLAGVLEHQLVLVLDQVTDPHNVGAIMRSAVAMGAGAIITTTRHSPAESGVLGKSASGALDLLEHAEVRNLAAALEELANAGFQTIGLDSEAGSDLENCVRAGKVALVLGAEGKGLRQKTRETCHTLARIDLPGSIVSLNVSNAAVLALYLVGRQLPAG